MPIAKSMGSNCDLEDWYPPGHGDFYEAFANSGLLQEFISQVSCAQLKAMATMYPKVFN